MPNRSAKKILPARCWRH